MKHALLLIALISLSFPVDVLVYHGTGCPHCAVTIDNFHKLAEKQAFNLSTKDVYSDDGARAELLSLYENMGYPIAKGGIPTTVIGGTMVVGELNYALEGLIISAAEAGKLPPGAYTSQTISDALAGLDVEMHHNGGAALSWPIVISAAIADSVNPCELAILAILSAAIVTSKGKKQALFAGLLFVAIVYVCYMLLGFGVIQVLNFAGISSAFYILVAFLSLYIAVEEFRMYRRGGDEACAGQNSALGRHVDKILMGEVSLITIAIIAVICAFILLPCSSGPYIVILGMLAENFDSQAVAYLAVYNLFFVLPMLAVVLLVYASESLMEKYMKTQKEYLKYVHLFASVVMFVLFLLMVSDIIGRL
ncbi:MAG: hypothetical protein ACP5NX_02015 [Candidatus Bilamarchaeaceae archaeon]